MKGCKTYLYKILVQDISTSGERAQDMGMKVQGMGHEISNGERVQDMDARAQSDNGCKTWAQDMGMRVQRVKGCKTWM